jgi:RNA polymerase sigma-70 factor (ECF subfamily)
MRRRRFGRAVIGGYPLMAFLFIGLSKRLGEAATMPPVIEQDRDHVSSGTAIVDALSTRIEKMAAYFGRVCGVDSDDLRQEAWVAVFEMAPNLDRTIGSPEQHLLKRARWRILDSIRSQRRRQHVPLSEIGDLCAPTTESWADADLTELNATLTLTQRRILRALLEGYTWREVGALVGCTSANVAYHVRKIRARYDALAAESYGDCATAIGPRVG